MKFESHVELKNRLIESLKKKYGKDRVGIHVSDLIYCLREVYFRRNNPQPITETELMFFVDGAERHRILEDLVDYEAEKTIFFEGVTGTIDLIYGGPVEIKTTRANNSLPPHYFKQLGFYCAMINSQVGFFIIQRLNNRDTPWEFIRVNWTREDLENLRNELRLKSSLLKEALEKKNPAILPKCEMFWKCKYCQHKDSCREVDTLILRKE